MLNISSGSAKIPKRGRNNFSKYNYVLAVDVINEVSRLLVKEGVCLNISQLGVKREQVGKNWHCVVECLATFSNVDNPKEQKKVNFFGIAADTLDKDLYKALTNGLKYLFTQQFLIVTDDVIDVEQDNKAEKNQSKPVSINEYMIPFGRHRGKSFKDCSKEDLINDAKFLTNNGEPKGQAKEFCDNLRKYLVQK